jgi:hypothetical protein
MQIISFSFMGVTSDGVISRGFGTSLKQLVRAVTSVSPSSCMNVRIYISYYLKFLFTYLFAIY